MASKVCNQFLPARDWDPHIFCDNCRGKKCFADDHYNNCHDWDDNMWQKVSDYHAKVSAQRERKKERKAKAASCLSGFSLSMPIPLSSLSFSFDSAVVLTVATSTVVCNVTFASSSLIVSAQPFVPPNVPVSGEPSQKKREDSEAVSVSKMEMWEEFEKYWSSRTRCSCSPMDRPGPSSSSTHSSHCASPGMNCSGLSFHSAPPADPICPASLAHPASPAP